MSAISILDRVGTPTIDTSITTGVLDVATTNRIANFGGLLLALNNTLSTLLQSNGGISLNSNSSTYTLGNGAGVNLPPTTVIAGQEVLLIDPATNRVYRRLFGTDDLSDVDTTTNVKFVGDRLVWDGTNYVNEVTRREVGFTVASWSAPAAGLRTISISQLSHLMPANQPITVHVQEDDGTSWIDTQIQEIAINKTTGEIILTILDGQQFDGRAIVKGL